MGLFDFLKRKQPPPPEVNEPSPEARLVLTMWKAMAAVQCAARAEDKRAALNAFYSS